MALLDDGRCDHVLQMGPAKQGRRRNIMFASIDNVQSVQPEVGDDVFMLVILTLTSEKTVCFSRMRKRNALGIPQAFERVVFDDGFIRIRTGQGTLWVAIRHDFIIFI